MNKEFNTIYSNNKNAVYGYLYYMTKDTSNAEDLCQETFLKIYQNMKCFRGECKERAWCITIARNTFLTWIKKKKLMISEGYEIDQLASGSERNPEEVVIEKENHKLIKDVMLLLKEEYRTILLLRDYEELSYKEIGKVTNLSESAVKIRIYRAREKYKLLYSQYR